MYVVGISGYYLLHLLIYEQQFVIEESKRGPWKLVHILGFVPGMLLSFPPREKTYDIRLSSITGTNRARLNPHLVMKKF